MVFSIFFGIIAVGILFNCVGLISFTVYKKKLYGALGLTLFTHHPNFLLTVFIPFKTFILWRFVWQIFQEHNKG